jgi:hypothetical protein
MRRRVQSRLLTHILTSFPLLWHNPVAFKGNLSPAQTRSRFGSPSSLTVEWFTVLFRIRKFMTSILRSEAVYRD